MGVESNNSIGEIEAVSTRQSDGDDSALEVVYEGSRADLAMNDLYYDGLFPTYTQSGYALESREVTSEGGFGRAVLRLRKTGDATSGYAVRTTFRVTMVETTYELQCHPKIAGTAAKARLAAMWLATDEAERVTVANDAASYRYRDAEGELTAIADADVRKFCAAYLAGIRTYVRYYPVIQRITLLKSPQGLSTNGNSFTGGTFAFAGDIDTYATPPISLAGYANTNWFKSRDDYVQNENRTWTRTEEWTYTPEGSGGDHAWIHS